MLLCLLLPLLAGALLPLFRFRRTVPLALYVELATLATSALVLRLLLTDSGGPAPVFTLITGFDITFRADGTGKIFAALAAFLWPLATLYAFEYMEHEERPNAFFAWYTVSYAATLAVAFAGNLPTLYLAFECLTLATLPLVTHKEDAASVRAGRKYVLYSIGGAALGFAALMLLLPAGGGEPFRAGGILRDAQALRWIFLLCFVGFGTKAAVLPMSAWLPAASVAPTPVTALLHAVAVVNAGAFAVLRVVYEVFGAEALFGTSVQDVALGLACVTVLFGSVMAVREHHLKRRLAWSTVSNLSYMLMGACLMTPAGRVGALSHMIFHGMMKITLFYCAGAVLVQTGREYVRDMRGFGRLMPYTFAVFTVAGTSLVGIPPLSGFVSKWNLLTAAAETGRAMGVAAIAALIVSSVLTAVYIYSVVTAAWFRPLEGDARELAGRRLDPRWPMKLTLAVTTLCVIAGGLWGGEIIRGLRPFS